MNTFGAPHDELELAQGDSKHPVDASRKLFAFADTPHLVKNIRNRLLSCKELRVHPSQMPAKWDHISTLYNADKLLPAELRVCPNLTVNHLQPSKVMKMRVRLATQIFSNSVAQGLEEIDGTADFCQQMNAMFDALNRNKPSLGVHVDSADYLVLKQSLVWLDDWEAERNVGHLSATQFLTSTTAEGLRKTPQFNDYNGSLPSEFWVCSCLHRESKPRFPQGRFFGAVRIAAGSNDHPAAVTFLQLYKLLAVYGVLKPPRSGNCSIKYDIPLTPMIKISDIREIYTEKSSSQSNIQKLKEQLDGLIEQGDWEVCDVIEHDYSLAPVFDSIIYYITGYLCKRIKRQSKCPVCQAAVGTSTPTCLLSSAALCRMDEQILHPNVQLFNFIRGIEAKFVANLNLPNVYSATSGNLEAYCWLNF
ncbi:hypothetical protein J437_LFUL016721 [Ladona fulva]|uniref:Transposable element P transposase-like GTP-binding insertion domain-containing protein n=1 Tax=Ladona fulva TaxID=123851 RepID=A0A8K0KLX0_LADFU|nr:hypothetical protein J437_LFUL016721 [Ladona fulva]